MHPTLARFLSLEATAQALQKGDIGGPEERALLEVAAKHPEQRQRVLAGAAQRSADPEAQEAVVFLAAHAALIDVRHDEQLKPVIAAATAALLADGAEEPEVDGILAALLIEEALGYDDDPDEFDRAFYMESVASLESLSKLSPERVNSLRSAFLLASPKTEKRTAEAVADALAELAWMDGPEPVNPEHLHGALELCGERLSKREAAMALPALSRFLELLAAQKLLGPLRRARLDAVLAALATPSGLA